MKDLKEMVNQMFVLKCACGMHPESGFNLCKFPVYNESYNAIFCEKCNHPTFLCVIDPKDSAKDPELAQAILKNYFVLHSDQAMLDKLAALRELHQKEQEPEILPIEGLTLAEILKTDE